MLRHLQKNFTPMVHEHDTNQLNFLKLSRNIINMNSIKYIFKWLKCPSFVEKKHTLQNTDYRDMIQVGLEYICPYKRYINHSDQIMSWDKLFR